MLDPPVAFSSHVVRGAQIGRALGFYREGQAAGYVMSIVGAVILLALYRAFVGRRHILR